MTFEQEVADALTKIVATWHYRDGTEETHVRLWTAEALAPRVAAAIQAAGVRVAEIMVRDLPPTDTSWHGEPERAALAALRGQP